MEYPRMKELLQDNSYVTQLLNHLLPLNREDREFAPITDGWIHAQASAEMTERYEQLTSEDDTFLHMVKVARNPAILNIPTSVESQTDRQRYILVTIIPDVPLTYECNFPLMQTMGIMALFSWEMSRAVAQASKEMMQVQVAEEPMQPILNNSQIEWVSLYVGKKPFEGKADIQTDSTPQNGGNMTLDIHLCEARDLLSDPLIAKLIDAYDADCTAESDQNSNMETRCGR